MNIGIQWIDASLVLGIAVLSFIDGFVAGRKKWKIKLKILRWNVIDIDEISSVQVDSEELPRTGPARPAE